MKITKRLEFWMNGLSNYGLRCNQIEDLRRSDGFPLQQEELPLNTTSNVCVSWPLNTRETNEM